MLQKLKHISSTTKISLVLPCYNPPENWEKVVVKSVASIEAKGLFSIDLIVVNDGSTQGVADAHLDFLRSNIPSVNVIDHGVNRGKGYALRQGVAEVKNDLIIYTDID
ncbi:MAG: glycosyltransferase, partial [Flavobacteriaceae bacterium]|nr:glycosyltransferase [Flavobacteriaceae bacterium]